MAVKQPAFQVVDQPTIQEFAPEGVIVQCQQCGAIRVDGIYVGRGLPLFQAVQVVHHGIKIVLDASHGICPQCRP